MNVVGRVNDRILAAMRDEWERMATKHQIIKDRHNGQRHVSRLFERWERKYGVTLELVVDCYWSEIVEWMRVERRVLFEPDVPPVLVELEVWIVDQTKAAFEVLLELEDMSLETIWELKRVAIQHILISRGCVKRYERDVAAGSGL